MLNFPKWKIWLIILVSVAGIYFAIASVTNISSPFLPNKKINLGLDLRGGSHILLEVDFLYYKKEQLENMIDEIRKELRSKQIDYIGLNLDADGISFSLKNDADIAETKKFLRSISDGLQIKQENGSFELNFSEEYVKKLQNLLIEQSMEIVRRRVDESGTKEIDLQRQGDNRILLQMPGVENPEQVKNILGKTAKLTFHLLNEANPYVSSRNIPTPIGTKIMESDDQGQTGRIFYIVQAKPILTGDMLVNATAAYENGMAVVSFKFNNLGAKKFGDVTKNNVNKPFAIVLDNKVLSAPVIREPILGGAGNISGNFTVESANELALLLRAGSLPAPLKVIEERTVGPSLGADSIEAGKKAVIIGMILVVIFMIVSYGWFGLVANIALILNLCIILSLLALMGATLTLPGVAGIALTTGMAVDANVLINERIREELRNGRTPFAAVEAGYKLAYNTIFDSNLTAIIAAVILYLVGVGPVKGFAVTLVIGVIASMFTAILVTRLIIATWLKRTKPSNIVI